MAITPATATITTGLAIDITGGSFTQPSGE